MAIQGHDKEVKIPKRGQSTSGKIKINQAEAESDSILARLKVKFPNVLPVKPTPSEDLARLQGRQDVIRFIEQLEELNQSKG